MTVCIASICDGGNVLVIASDRMLSAPFPDLEFGHHDRKIKSLSANCIAPGAGDALITTEIYDGIEDEIHQTGAINVKDLNQTPRSGFAAARRRLVGQTIFAPRGMTLDDFYSGRLSALLPDISYQIDRDARAFDLAVRFILCGVDAAGARVSAIEHPAMEVPMDRLGFHAIGSGAGHGSESKLTWLPL